MKQVLLPIALIVSVNLILAQSFVTISGKVTDYNGNPLDSCHVSLGNADFSALEYSGVRF